MKLRDYIEKRASSRRQLRLAKKYSQEAKPAFEAYMGHHGFGPSGLRRVGSVPYKSLSPKELKEAQKAMDLGYVGDVMKEKHDLGRKAAKAYAMGDQAGGDYFAGKGLDAMHHRKQMMQHLKGNRALQRKARKAFGRINK